MFKLAPHHRTKTISWQMESAVFENTHLALKAVLEVTPLASRQAVLQYAKECLPYTMTTDTRAHTKYLVPV
jgi:hypothetical protein